MTPNAASTPRATLPCGACGKLNGVDLARSGKAPRCGACGVPLVLDRPVHGTSGNFDRIIGGSTIPVLVDFYADWCGPCKIMAPLLDELARSRAGRALVVKLNTDDHPEPSARFGIRGIPTLILFESGRETKRQVGAVPRAVLEGMV